MPSPRTLEQTAWRLLVAGFDGTEPPAALLDCIRRGLGGVILFKRNVENPRQVASLNRALKAATNEPLLLSVDQEGGRVARLREPWTVWPPMRLLGTSGDEALAQQVGATLAAELGACGFDLDYAPVLDVDSNPANPVIGDRSFGRDPQTVGRLGAALVRGLQQNGIAACGKHFPGHGDTAQDSHLDLPRLAHGPERLRQVELPPFRAAIEAGVASIMTAHVVFEALDPGMPATMSAKAVDGLLRRELGYQGLVVSDDLEMKAVHERFPLHEVVERALLAGVDAFLVCRLPELQRQAHEIIVQAVESGRVPRARVDEACARVEAVQRAYARPASAVDPEAAERAAGAAQHRMVASRFAPHGTGLA